MWVGPWTCQLYITLLSVQLSFCGPSKYNNEMLEKLLKDTHTHIELPTSHFYIVRVHVAD